MFGLILYLFFYECNSHARWVPDKTVNDAKITFVDRDFRGKEEYFANILNRKAEGFNGRYEASSHKEMLELFLASTSSSFGSNPRVT